MLADGDRFIDCLVGQGSVAYAANLHGPVTVRDFTGSGRGPVSGTIIIGPYR